MLAISGASWKLVFTPLTKKIRRLRMLKGQILEFDCMINAWHDPTMRTIGSMPDRDVRLGDARCGWPTK
jgi:hypothetical protein